MNHILNAKINFPGGFIAIDTSWDNELKRHVSLPLSQLHKEIQHPLDPKKTLILAGVVNFKPAASTRSSDSSKVDNHYTGICLRNGKWYEYCDLYKTSSGATLKPKYLKDDKGKRQCTPALLVYMSREKKIDK